MNTLEFDQILIPIAAEQSHRANEILELREAALRHHDPGRCISCYFKLLAGSRSGSKQTTTPLRRWLEQHLVVVARNSASPLQELERLPVQLKTDDIEGYCQQVMDAFRYDRSYQDIPSIELTFRFKEGASAA